VVLEAELVEINKDLTYCEQCVQKYGYVSPPAPSIPDDACCMQGSRPASPPHPLCYHAFWSKDAHHRLLTHV
jgi:hypothetical protein